ncbi:MAG: energy transducer TonB [Sphingomicrobium sp.]
MLAYAESRQRIGERRSSPSTMLMIIGAHVAVIAVAMTMKMAIDHAPPFKPIYVDFIKQPEPPPPNPVQTQRAVRSKSVLDQPKKIIETSTGQPTDVDNTDVPITPGTQLAGNDIPIDFPPFRPIVADPVRIGPRLATPESALKPPYPPSKLDSQQEAALRLQLQIDDNGRVVGVQPIGVVDRAFFEAARKHLLARWRYKPATVDGNPVPSSTQITLRFELDG